MLRSRDTSRGNVEQKAAGNAGERSHKTTFPRGLAVSHRAHTKPTGSYFLLLLLLKKQQWEKLNNGLGSLPMYSITW